MFEFRVSRPFSLAKARIPKTQTSRATSTNV
jgi:hypothetical protein